MRRSSRTQWLLIVAFFTLACSSTELQPEPSGAAPSARIRWVKAVAASASRLFEAPAQVIASPNDTAHISAPMSARVLRIRVKPGQRVEKGDVLVDVLMPELIRAAGALRSAELRLQSWQERRAVVAPLVDKQLAPAAELSEVNANIAAVRGDRENARAILRAAGESDRRVEALLAGDGSVPLRAPFAGVVVSVLATVGEVREPGAGPLLKVVTEDDDLRVEARFASVPAQGSRFVWVAHGQRVPLVLERFSPHAEERDGSRLGWLRVSEGKTGLVAGTLGRVEVVAPDDWVVVPARALRERDGESTVEIRTTDGSRRAPVTVLQHSAGEAVVTGIAPDAEVAVDANAPEAPRS